MSILLEPHELSKLKSNKWIDGRWFYNPHEITKAQLKKVGEFIESLDNGLRSSVSWRYEVRELRRAILKEIE